MKKTTKRIDPAVLEGKSPVAEGYKIFNWDWTGYDGYCYADENGDVEGSVHTVTGKLDKCGWGLHYSVNPIDCMRYKDFIQWNKFAEVEAYDEDINAGDKSLCRTMKIVKVLSFDEMIEAIKSYQKETLYGYGISNGSGISDGYGIRYGYGISNGYGISDGHGISYGYGISGGYGISDGSGIRYGYGISNGYGISGGYGISDGYGIRYGYGISNGYGISDGYGISNGYGISDGSGINQSKFCTKCEGISRCICCYDISGKLMIFNKPVSEKRFNEVWRKLGVWYPQFTNAEALKEKYGEGEWEKTPAAAIEGRSVKDAYAEMPDILKEYIYSLPEFDADIWAKITETEE